MHAAMLSARLCWKQLEVTAASFQMLQMMRQSCVAQKLSRKLVHILAGPGFALCWPLFRFSYSQHNMLCSA